MSQWFWRRNRCLGLRLRRGGLDLTIEIDRSGRVPRRAAVTIGIVVAVGAVALVSGALGTHQHETPPRIVVPTKCDRVFMRASTACSAAARTDAPYMVSRDLVPTAYQSPANRLTQIVNALWNGTGDSY